MGIEGGLTAFTLLEQKCPVMFLELLPEEHDPPSATMGPWDCQSFTGYVQRRWRCGVTALGSLQYHGAIRVTLHLHRHSRDTGTGYWRKTCAAGDVSREGTQKV